MESTKWHPTHKAAWAHWSRLVEDEGLTAELVTGEKSGYVVRWWEPEPARKEG